MKLLMSNAHKKSEIIPVKASDSELTVPLVIIGLTKNTSNEFSIDYL